MKMLTVLIVLASISLCISPQSSTDKKSLDANYLRITGMTGGALSVADACAQWGIDMRQMATLTTGCYDKTLNNRVLQTCLAVYQTFLRLATCVMYLSYKGKQLTRLMTAQLIACGAALCEFGFRLKTIYGDLYLSTQEQAFSAGVALQPKRITLMRWILGACSTLRFLLRFFRGSIEAITWKRCL